MVKMMNKKNALFGALIATALGFSATAYAHGDMVPQSVDTAGLPSLGEEWLDSNPYRAPSELNAKAVEIGASAYNQNCARCHGLEAMSGGIAPDLRLMQPNESDDEWYKDRVINGAVRNGAVYMPKMAEHISQEALWAIRTYIESRAELQ